MRVGLFGYGAINRLVARVVLERGWEIVGVVDKDPKILGEDAGKLAGLEPLGVKVSNKPEVLK
ncbi:MAG: dihydrodipicolinate reductase, partial [Desulfurococcales archaeon]|nr:dihydrodipicolinate reductase [Desulfurococcales archaeon]